ncbi:MAG: carbohydrate-binding domain-containing protein [Clostridia bacterium]|nr:carbohydrate-binding domain-containing protein [Clostridia bacterium]
MRFSIKKLILCLLMAATVALPLAGCKKQTNPAVTTPVVTFATDENGQPQLTDPSTQAAASITAEFSNFDLTDTYETVTAKITCSGKTATIEGDGARQDGDLLEITAGGSYLLCGDYSGQIVVSAPDTDKVQLVLAGFSVTYSTGSPILCESADKVAITLAKGTKNTVTDTGSGSVDVEDGEEDPNTRTAGAIHGKCALTINGSGSLTVKASYHNGIHTKKTLKLVGGNVSVEAADDGFKGKNAVAIRGGNLTVISGEDGIQCSEEANTAHGYIWIEGGTVNITAEGDGIDASLYLIQKGGEVTVNAIGTDRKEGTSSSGNMGGGMRPGMGGSSSSGGYETNSDGYYKIDSKGVKAGVSIALSGGRMTVNSTGHAVKSSGTLSIGGDVELTVKAYCEAYRANSKGISADADLLISGGNITILYSYEGVESSGGTIYVTGGSVRVEYAVDDGFNTSAGGSMMGGGFGGGGGMTPPDMGGMTPPDMEGETDTAVPTEAAGIVISGGYTFVNAFGDGLDSNQNIYISGGTVVVAGPTNSGNGALDSGDNNNHISVTGGILVAYGASGMAEVPDASVTSQCTLAHNVGLSAGDLFTVLNKDGKPIIAVEIAEGNVGQSIVLSCPGLVQGETYTLVSGGSVEGESTDGLYASPVSHSGGSEIASLTLSSTVTGSSGGMGGPGGDGGGHGGGRPGRW